ncbi:MAG: VCBS repeat-containing protein [Sedimentisphaerales bacterium]|nr:VCBS repeat-containing protein [Sedimentisphaerales bacterium]
MLRTLLAVLTVVGISAGIAGGSELAAPIRLEADGKPIDTEIGHAAPCVADFDGDGVQDLLVGQFGQGLLWIYRNEGTSAEPKLAAGVKFKEGVEDGRVPSG